MNAKEFSEKYVDYLTAESIQNALSLTGDQYKDRSKYKNLRSLISTICSNTDIKNAVRIASSSYLFGDAILNVEEKYKEADEEDKRIYEDFVFDSIKTTGKSNTNNSRNYLYCLENNFMGFIRKYTKITDADDNRYLSSPFRYRGHDRIIFSDDDSLKEIIKRNPEKMLELINKTKLSASTLPSYYSMRNDISKWFEVIENGFDMLIDDKSLIKSFCPLTDGEMGYFGCDKINDDVELAKGMLAYDQYITKVTDTKYCDVAISMLNKNLTECAVDRMFQLFSTIGGATKSYYMKEIFPNGTENALFDNIENTSKFLTKMIAIGHHVPEELLNRVDDLVTNARLILAIK